MKTNKMTDIKKYIVPTAGAAAAGGISSFWLFQICGLTGMVQVIGIWFGIVMGALFGLAVELHFR